MGKPANRVSRPMKLSAAATVAICLSLAGCVTERIIERPVPALVPSLCVTECPYSTEKPATNGALLESWHERGEALECFKVRMQCVRELTRQ